MMTILSRCQCVDKMYHINVFLDHLPRHFDILRMHIRTFEYGEDVSLSISHAITSNILKAQRVSIYFAMRMHYFGRLGSLFYQRVSKVLTSYIIRYQFNGLSHQLRPCLTLYGKRGRKVVVFWQINNCKFGSVWFRINLILICVVHILL